MTTQYFTLGSGQPGGPGTIKAQGPSASLCRDAVYAYTAGRFAFQYGNLDDIHPLDRNIVKCIGVNESGDWWIHEDEKDDEIDV